MDPGSKPPLVVIAGPTASGKSALAMALAERHRGVVINADASQVYADLRLLTARPSREDEARVPHRLFGHVGGADVGYSVARWAREARAAIAEVHAAGKLPILVGGSGMYIRTLIEGIAPVPEIDPAIRAAVRAASVANNHAALAIADPQAAARLNPADTMRVARALEVVRSTGRTLAAWQVKRRGGIGKNVALTALILLPPRDWLDDRIFRRALEITGSSVSEVMALLARTDVPPDSPIRHAIGVPEMTQYVRGEIDDVQVNLALDLATRQYAKRQYTWYRNQSPPDWPRLTEPCEGDAIGRAVAMVTALLARTPLDTEET